jgi:hypothetical protein
VAGSNQVNLAWTIPLDQGVSIANSATEATTGIVSGGANGYVRGDVGVQVYRNGAVVSGWGTGTSLNDMGLAPNTLYIYTLEARDNNSGARGVWNNTTGPQGTNSAWTLSVPPGLGSVTPDQSSPPVSSTVTWTAVGGFGAGTVQYYRYVWDMSPAHTWADTEPQWSSGTLATVATSAGTWFLHVKGYNGADVGNGSYDYPLTVNTKALTVTGIGASNKVYDGTPTAALTGTPGTLSGVVGGDNVTLGGTAAGAFADANVGTGKTVTVSGQTLGGTNAGSYTLTEPTATADITGAGTTTALVSSQNPSGPGSNVTFTATVSSVAGIPAGNVVFLANNVPFSTNTLVGGSIGASTTSLPLGTNRVAAQYAVQGNYLGSTGAVQQVVQSSVVLSQTNVVSSMVDNGNGTFTLNFIGTPLAKYYVVSSADPLTSMSIWDILTDTTNTAPPPAGMWSVTVTNNAAQKFYRAAAVNPGP